MTSDHYFTASPASADERRTIEVELNGSLRKVQTASGIFSPAGLDKGTAVLLQYVPTPRGRILDIGCGWGPITLTAAEQSPGSEVYGVDVNERSIDLARLNATAFGLSERCRGQPGFHKSKPAASTPFGPTRRFALARMPCMSC